MKKTKVTLRSLAQELGIAPATVLRALTNHPNVTQGLRRRVIALAQKYHYQLPEHYKKLVAVVIPGFEFEGYTGLLLSSLMKELSGRTADSGRKIPCRFSSATKALPRSDSL